VWRALVVQMLRIRWYKGARLTAQISIAGRLLVSCRRTTTLVSQKIPASSRDDCLKRMQLLSGELGGGFILPQRRDAHDTELSEDGTEKTWAHQEAALRVKPRPCCIRI
jgi:Ribonuclease G/E